MYKIGTSRIPGFGAEVQNHAPTVLALTLTLFVTGRAIGAETPPAMAGPRNPRVQAELNRLARHPFASEPAKRPLITSEPATNELQWGQRALSHGYAASGHTNSKWDASVRQAFSDYAAYSLAAKTDRYKPMVEAVSAALAANCDDPLIKYLDVRYRLASETADGEAFALAALRANEAMLDSRYHPWLKFYSGYRAINAARSVDPGGDRNPLVIATTVALEDAIRDTNASANLVFDLAEMWLAYSKGTNWLEGIMGDVHPLLEKTRGEGARWFQYLGALEVDRAWGERGGGYVSTVNEKGWEGFKLHLDKAEQALNQAWQMDSKVPRTAYQLMRVELGQGRGLPTMQKWFNRCMALETNYWDAAKLMAFYLEPRWYGSKEESLKFCRSCVASSRWGGSVPLVLQETHHSLARYYQQTEARTYWQSPGVWEDVKSSYEKFFRLNPEDTSYRHNYAKDAYLCGQYRDFLQQTKLFGTGTNFTFFGGEQRFRDMLAKAKAESGSN